MPNVSNVKSKQLLYGTDTDAISATGTATTLVLLNSGPWINAQTVTLTSSADNSGITFAIVGKDADGAAQTVAAHTGPNATINSVTGTWTQITSITASGAITTQIEAGVTGGATTGIVFAGRTRIRGLQGLSAATAGNLLFKNTSVTGTTLMTVPTSTSTTDLIEPYIPDNAVLFDAGAFVSFGAGLAAGVTVFYDG